MSLFAAHLMEACLSWTFPPLRLAGNRRGALVGTAIVQVLANRALFRVITAFMTGTPLLVLNFEKDVVSNYEGPSQNGGKEAHAFSKHTTGLLIHVAIAENNVAADTKDAFEPRHALYCVLWPTEGAQVAVPSAIEGPRVDVRARRDAERAQEPKARHESLAMAVRELPTRGRASRPLGVVNQLRYGNLDVVRFIYVHGCGLTEFAMATAAGHGHLELVRFLHELDDASLRCTTEAMDNAAACRSLEVIQFLHENRDEGCTTRAMDEAAFVGDLEIVEWLHKNRSEGCSPVAMQSAAMKGHLGVVRFLYEHYPGANPDHYAMDAAARARHLDILQFLHQVGAEGSLFAMDQSTVWSAYFNVMDMFSDGRHLAKNHKEMFYVTEGVDLEGFLAELHAEVGATNATDMEARRKHLEVIEFLHENRNDGCTCEVMDETARIGHLEVVQFLHEHRIEGCTTDAMNNAAWRGHLEVVRFLHENRAEGCATDAIDFAAREGYLEVIKFLFANRVEGCTTEAMDNAAAAGHLEVVNYLHEHRSEGGTTDAMDFAAKNGHLDVLRFLHYHREEGYITDAMDDAAAAGHLDIVKFLHEVKRESCTTRAMDSAAAYGHMDVVRFLHENESVGCTTDAMDLICGSANSLEIVQFLHDHRSERCTSEALDVALQAKDIDTVRFLHENQPEVDLFSKVATATVLSNHEFIKFACQSVPDAIPDALLNNAVVTEEVVPLLGVLCVFSTKGCLFEAKKIALQYGHLHSVQVLDAYLSRDLDSCSLVQHSTEGPRRCQRTTKARMGLYKLQ